MILPQSIRKSAIFVLGLLLTGCSVEQRIGKIASKEMLQAAPLKNAHTGITIYEPATGKSWFDYQGDKYFTPASNTKIVTCYAALKHLGDSITGLEYIDAPAALYIFPTADPTLLHSDYPVQPVVRFLQHAQKPLVLVNTQWKSAPLGTGWAWDDYNADYMPERSSLPVYGDVIRFVNTQANGEHGPENSVFTQPEISWPVHFAPEAGSFYVRRRFAANDFTVTQGKEKFRQQDVPFVTNGVEAALLLLKDTTGKTITLANDVPALSGSLQQVNSQPLDSVLTPMMHRSDNFFAEQALLMVSHKILGVMNDSKITDTLLKTDLSGLPQSPSWADGSGLSRFNLFTPQDLVWVLKKMQAEFPASRLHTIFATGNTGTLAGYYKADSGYLYAKTGTLNGVVALSGFLTTKKNKQLIFSVLVNNHHSSGRLVRRCVEQFIQRLRDDY